MNVLAIDPGTKCGWAFGREPALQLSGVWDLAPRRHEGGGMRFVRLQRLLGEFSDAPALVAYEEVRRHRGTDAAHIYGGIVATLQAWCEERSIPYTAIPVGTIKRHATGKGNADKVAMLEAARARFGEGVIDDNQADALWLLSVALDTEVPR